MDDTAEPATGSILWKKVFLKTLQTPTPMADNNIFKFMTITNTNLVLIYSF